MKVPGQKIEIALSKSKLILMLFGAMTFVALGIWYVIVPPTIENSYWNNPTKIKIVSYSSIIFFGLCTIFLLRKLLDNKSGLIIDDSGLVDNSGGLAAGQILWADIKDISVRKVYSQKLIMLYLKNPQDYIERQTSLFKRIGMQFNYKMYKTPISITANGLNISFDQLLTILTNRFQEIRTNAQQ